MRFLRIILSLLMVIGILSITPGCVTQSSADNPDSRIIAVNRTELPTPEVINSTTIIPTVCPSSANQSYWIKINPIGNVTIGELILVDGTTNIPVGTTLTSDIYYESFTPGIVSPTRSIRGFAEVRETDNCINNFTFQANSTDLGIPYLFKSCVFLPGPSLSDPSAAINCSEFFVVDR